MTGLEQRTWAQMQWACPTKKRLRHEDHLTFKAQFVQLPPDIGLHSSVEETVGGSLWENDIWILNILLFVQQISKSLFLKSLNFIGFSRVDSLPFFFSWNVSWRLQASPPPKCHFLSDFTASQSLPVLSLFSSLNSQCRSFFYPFTLWHFLPYVSVLRDPYFTAIYRAIRAGELS